MLRLTPLLALAALAPAGAWVAPQWRMSAKKDGSLKEGKLRFNLGQKLAAGALAAGLALGPALPVEAAQSGGRIGSGSGGFSRSAPSPRTGGTSMGSYRGGGDRGGYSGGGYNRGPTFNTIVVPGGGYGLSPFGASPFGYGGAAVVPFGGYGGGLWHGFHPFQSLALGFAAITVFRALTSNRLGSSWDNTVAADAADITVVRVNLAVNLNSRQDSIIQRLSTIAADRAGGAAGESGNIFSTKRMGELTSEVCLTMLRQRSNWQAANFDAAYFRGDTAEAETAFNRRVVLERSKFEKEEVSPLAVGDRGAPTLAVVTLVVGVKGASKGILQDVTRGKARINVNTMVELLETIAAEASTTAFGDSSDPDRGLVGSEILWTPSTPDETLGRQEVLLDYPELIDF